MINIRGIVVLVLLAAFATAAYAAPHVVPPGCKAVTVIPDLIDRLDCSERDAARNAEYCTWYRQHGLRNWNSDRVCGK